MCESSGSDWLAGLILGLMLGSLIGSLADYYLVKHHSQYAIGTHEHWEIVEDN